MTISLNRSVAVAVTAYDYGPEALDGEGNPYFPIVGVKPGARLDVQRECLDVHPGLAAYAVVPATPIHDCGPNGIHLFAATEAELQAAAPVTGSCWDVWVERGP